MYKFNDFDNNDTLYTRVDVKTKYYLITLLHSGLRGQKNKYSHYNIRFKRLE